MVTYVTAHEIAHQWWAHQVVGATSRARRCWSRRFAQYSALLVMEKLYGKEQIRRFLKYELDRYLRARGGELVEELPLARVENQPYIHYQKGSLVMYWLKEVVGERGGQPRAAAPARSSTRSSRRRTRTPPTSCGSCARRPGPQHDALITDLFEKITLLRREGDARDARRRRADGKYEVTLRRSRRASSTPTARASRPRRRWTSPSTSASSPPSRASRTSRRASVLAVRAAADPERQADGHAGRRPRADVRRRRSVQQAHRPQLRRQPRARRGALTRHFGGRAASVGRGPELRRRAASSRRRGRPGIRAWRRAPR